MRDKRAGPGRPPGLCPGRAGRVRAGQGRSGRVSCPAEAGGGPGATSWAAPGSGLRPRTGSACRLRHAAAPGCPPLDSGPGRWLPASGGAEAPPARVPHQRHPAHGRLRRSAGSCPLGREGQAAPPRPSPGPHPPASVCRDVAPRGRGVLLPLPAGAGPPGRGHRREGGAPGGSHDGQHLPEAVSPAPTRPTPARACPAVPRGWLPRVGA